MVVALPYRRQHQLLTNCFAAAEKLEKSKKKNSPVLEIQKSRGYYFKSAHLFYPWWVVLRKGGDAMKT